MRKDASAVLIKKERWGSYLRLLVRSPGIAGEAQPGQFIMVRVSDTGHPLLRRPLGVHAKDDETIGLFFSVSGLGTALLARKEEGDSLDLLGPLGRGFSVGRPGPTERPALIVGGGRGIAPLYFLAKELHRSGHKVKVLYGGRSVDDIPLRRLFEEACWETSFSTDDGSLGYHGFVTGLLLEEIEKGPVERVYACGPEPMLKEVSRLALAKSIPAELSLEARMGCGFGACWGCVRKIRRPDGEGWLKICEEGPVFPAEEVVWE